MTWTTAHIQRIFDIYDVQPNDTRNNKRIVTMLLKMYERQTDAEKNHGDTMESNGIGFNGIDGNILSSIAEFYNERNFISDKQLKIVATKLRRYKKQLTEIANTQSQSQSKEQTQ